MLGYIDVTADGAYSCNCALRLNGIMKRKGGHKADDPEKTTNINESVSCLDVLLKTHRI